MILKKNDIPKTSEELQKELDDQVKIIKSHISHFDKGEFIFAKEIATKIRVLLHETDKSHSLFCQLGINGRQFISTALTRVSCNGFVPVYRGLSMTFIGTHKTFIGAKEIPNLDYCGGNRMVFDQWREECILVDDKGNEFSRKSVVLNMANKAGGAHVDRFINKDFKRLSSGESSGSFYIKKDKHIPVDTIESIAIRQIAHEVLKTLDPLYTCALKGASGTLINIMSDNSMYMTFIGK